METPMDYEMGYAQGYDEGRQHGNSEAWQDFVIEIQELKKRNEALEERVQSAFSTISQIEKLSQQLFVLLYQTRA